MSKAPDPSTDSFFHELGAIADVIERLQDQSYNEYARTMPMTDPVLLKIDYLATKLAELHSMLIMIAIGHEDQVADVHYEVVEEALGLEVDESVRN
jgi:hypothetical protein